MLKQLWSDNVLEPTWQKTAAQRARDRKDNLGKTLCEEEDKEQPQAVILTLVLGLALNHSKAAVGSSEVMEVNESHLTLFTDLCVEFSSLLRICRPQAHMEGAKLQNGWVASPLFLSRAVASTFTESHWRGRGAHRSKGNKSNADTLPVCVWLCVWMHLFIRACVWVSCHFN